MVIGSFLCPSDPASRRGSDGSAVTNYAACHHDREALIGAKNVGCFFLNSFLRIDDITDGTSQTIFVSERLMDTPDFGWASGTRSTLRNVGSPFSVSRGGFGRLPIGGNVVDYDEDDSKAILALPNFDPVGGFGSAHAGGINVLWGDGGVRFLKNRISRKLLRSLANRADGEILDDGEF